MGELDFFQTLYLMPLRTHNYKSACVPYFVHKVAASLDLRVGVARIVSRGHALQQREAQTVRTVFIYDYKGVYAVAETL